MTTKYQSPIGHGMQFFDANGDPLSGGKLYTYQAGTTTAKATYKDNAGAASHTNPVVLGADGFVPGGALWLDTDVAYKFTLKSADDAITYFTVDNVAGLADKAYVDSLAQDEWISGPTPTFIDATSFSVSGDQTTALHAGRAIKLTDSSTLYGVITAASYSAGPGLTTVTVLINDGTDLSGSLSAIAYGFQSATENQLSLPAVRRVIFLEDADHDLYLDADYVIDPTTPRTLTLQNSYKKGMRPRVVNLASGQAVTINTQDGDTLMSLTDGSVYLEAKQDSPTDDTHWQNSPSLLLNPVISGSASGTATLPTAMLKEDNGITQGMLGDASVGQGELKSASQIDSEAALGNGLSHATAASGGTYTFNVFWSAATGLADLRYVAHLSTNTYTTTSVLRNNAGTASNIYFNSRYIQASPPYDLGSGEIPLFVFVSLDAGGRIVGVNVAPDPPWANNGPTPLNPLHPRVRSDVDPESRARRPRWLRVPKQGRPGPGAGKNEIDAYLARLADPGNPEHYQEIEITQAVKNRDMALIPHPWQASEIIGAGSVVLLDPCCDLMERLLHIHEAGMADEQVSDLLMNDWLRIDTRTELDVARPPGVRSLPVQWRAHG